MSENRSFQRVNENKTKDEKEGLQASILYIFISYSNNIIITKGINKYIIY